MKKFIILSFLVTFLSVLIISCGGSKSISSADAGDIPDWYTNVPQDPNYHFASRTASSQDMQLAVDKAATDARAEISRFIEVKLSGLQKKFDEEVGAGENSTLLQQFTQATKTVVSQVLTGSKIKEQKLFKTGNLWRAYVLAEYPIGAANQALMQQLKKNNELYTRFRASQTFEELDKEIQKYEEWKDKQK